MKNKYYATYVSSKFVLVFDNKKERDNYVKMEKIVHPECITVSYDKVKNLIEGKIPVYDKGFGCDVILVA
ncbi:MAG: hypothetical protein IKO36_02585 [Bacteroidaceae bacterium]|nr:hypothetical protein [Bacteroidaceae bacterium]